MFTNSACYDDLNALIQDSDAIFLTVPDGSITPVYRQVCAYELSNKQICHCSGALSAGEAFPDIERTGAFGYSIHPLFPVSSKYEAYKGLADAFFCVEGQGPHLEQWKQRLEALGLRVQVIGAEAKVRYHAACAISSNLMCALAAESLELLESCGFSEELARKALTPLMKSNLDHLIADGPVEALTGPVERCDIATVQKHLDCFSDEEDRALYRAASRRLVRVAQEKHPETDYQPMKNLLKGAH